MNRALGLVALVGTVALVLTEAVDAFPLAPRQWMAFVVLGVFAVLVPVVFRLLLRGPHGILRRNLRLLVPLLVMQPLLYGIGLLLGLPALTFLHDELTAFSIGVVSLSLSLAMLFYLAAWVLYGAWTTLLLLGAVREETVDPVAALGPALRAFLRTFLFETVGLVGLLAIVAFALGLGPAMGAAAYVVFAVLVVAWNLLTAAILPLGLSGGLTVTGTFGALFRVAIPGLRRWGPAVVVQLLLLGLVTWTSVTLVERTTETVTGSDGVTRTDTSVTRSSNTSWSVNAKWVGGYENETAWSGEVMKALKSSEPAVVATLLWLLLGVFALGVKLRVILAFHRGEVSA